MNGGITYRDLEEWKRKAALYDALMAALSQPQNQEPAEPTLRDKDILP